MKTKFSLVLATAVMVAANALGATELSPDSRFLVTCTAGLKYDDNIYLTSTGTKSSAIFDFIPGVAFEAGSSSLMQNKFAFSEDFVNYLSASNQNSSLANAQYDASYSDAKLSFKLGAGFHQTLGLEDTHTNGVIAQTDVILVTPVVEWEISPKTALGVGVVYENYAYDTPGFSDRSSVAVPLNVYYELAPKLQGSLGYRFRHNSLDLPAADSDDSYFSLGARGEFDPKLTGTLSAGYTQRKIKAVTVGGHLTPGRTESAFGLEAKLDYLYSEKTTLQLTARNDFSNAATGDSQKVFELGARMVSVVSEVLTADAEVNYSNYQYLSSARTDDFLRLQTGLTYRIRRNVSVNASYRYHDNSSNALGTSFRSNVVGLAVAVNY